jgi:hypothetical protein
MPEKTALGKRRQEAIWDYTVLRDSDKSIQVLEREYARHNPMVLNARTSQELDSLRTAPRFQAFLQKLGPP